MKKYTFKYSELEKNQPLQVLGLVGSVACGKSTLTKILTGVTTQRHSSELINNASIKLGYTNLEIYKNPSTNDYICNPKNKCELMSKGYELIKSISISDAPGHNSYFASMLSGSKFMDICLFLISGINGIEPQTYQHIKVLKSLNVTKFSMVITKADQIKTNLKFIDLHDNIIDLLDNYFPYDEYKIDPYIFPISNITKTNINNIIEYLAYAEYPDINYKINKKAHLTIIRSFDINRPGKSIDKLYGATIGGVLTQGNLMLNDMICILPGIKLSSTSYKPMITKVVSLRSDTNDLSVAVPGGFIAISTTLDPFLGKDDNLVGQVVIRLENVNEIDDIKLSKQVSLSEIVYYNLDLTFNLGETIIIMYYGSTIFGKVKEILSKVHNVIIEFNSHIFGNIGDEVMLLKTNKGSLDFFAKALISDIKYDENINIIYDREELDNFFENTESRELNCINDKNVNSASLVFPDYQNLIKNFQMNNIIKKHTPKFELPILEKGTIKFGLKNARNMMKLFFPLESNNEMHIDLNKNLRLENKLLIKFADIIKNKYNANSYSILDSEIIVSGIKNVKKKINTDGIMQCYNTLINDNFNCINCGNFASIYLNGDNKICRICNANTYFKY